jgi:hypothetical protein
MKATLVNSMPNGDWIYEIKLDGYRALALTPPSKKPGVLSPKNAKKRHCFDLSIICSQERDAQAWKAIPQRELDHSQPAG